MTEFINITKTYNKTKVLDGFSLSVANGEKNVLMGESGVGKTTLLDIAAGLVKCDSGEFKTDRRIAYMFQEPRLLPTFDVQENVMAPLKSKDRHKLGENYLKSVELWDHKDKYPSELSGGMAQRVAFARFLAFAEETDANLLLLDEPFSAIDEEMRDRMISLFIEFAKEKSVIYVTHNSTEAEKISENIIKL